MHASALLNSIITMLVALGFAGLAAQKPQTTQKPQEVPGAQEPVARITTELVQLDIVVTDRDGKLVRELKREDFQLVEDGKAQLITHFAEGTAARPAKWLSSERKRQPPNFLNFLPTVRNHEIKLETVCLPASGRLARWSLVCGAGLGSPLALLRSQRAARAHRARCRHDRSWRLLVRGGVRRASSAGRQAKSHAVPLRGAHS